MGAPPGKQPARARRAVLAAGLIALAGCTSSPGETPASDPATTDDAAPAAQTSTATITPEVELNPVTVVDVIDGRTLLVTLGATPSVVELVYVRTPSLGNSDRRPECLSAEAKQLMTELAPVNSRVLLGSVNTGAKQGRSLATVFTTGGRNVGETIIAAGLGVAVVGGRTTPTAQGMLRAQRQAKADGAGLYSADVDCTLPGQVSDVWCGPSEDPNLPSPGTPRSTVRSAATPTTGGHLVEPVPAPTPAIVVSRSAAERSADGFIDCAARGEVPDPSPDPVAARDLADRFAGDRTGIVWEALSAKEELVLTHKVRAAVDKAVGGAP